VPSERCSIEEQSIEYLDGRVVSSDVVNNWCICWFSRIFLLGILIFKGLTALRRYKSFGVKGLIR
jgi:hypothetical protein